MWPIHFKCKKKLNVTKVNPNHQTLQNLWKQLKIQEKILFLKEELKSKNKVLKPITDLEIITLDILSHQKQRRQMKSKQQTTFTLKMDSPQATISKETNLISILTINNSNKNKNYYSMIKILELPKNAKTVNHSRIPNTIISSIMETYSQI